MKALLITLESYLWIIGLLVKKGRLLFLCFKPWLFGLALWALLFGVGYYFFGSIHFELTKDEVGAFTILGMSDSSVSVINWLSQAAVIPILFITSGILALLFSLIINEYMVDQFIAEIFNEASGSRPPQKRGPLKQTVDCLVRLAVSFSFFLAILLTGVIPFFWLVSAFLSVFTLGYAIVDCPLCIRGYGMRKRFQFISREVVAVFCIGLVFSLTLAAPGLSFILLPIGYGAAAKLISELEP